MIFYAAEIGAFVPATGAGSLSYTWGAASWGALYQLPEVFSTSTTFRYSDVGYRTAATDAGGVVSYPPLIVEAFAIDRTINLDLSASNVGASWGSVQISNADGSLNSLVSAWNNDGRPAQVLYGTKTVENFPGQRSSRTTIGTYVDGVSVVQTAAAGTVRSDYSTNAAVTNYVRNSTCQGGAVGALPTYWATAIPAGLTATLLGNFQFGDVTVYRVRVSGTLAANQSVTIRPEYSASIGAIGGLVAGQSLTMSLYTALVNGTLPANANFWGRIVDAGSVARQDNQPSIAITSTLQRFSSTQTIPGTGTAPYRLEGISLLLYLVAGAVDFTVDVGAPQAEISASMGVFVPTSGAVVSQKQGSPTLLNEPAATNLCPTSNAQTGGTWGGTVTVAQNAVVAPDGATTATRFVCSAVGPGGGLSAKYLSPPVGSYTISVWMRADTSLSVSLYACWDDSGATQHATLRTTNLTTTWQRIQLSAITTTAGALRVYWQVNLLASQTVYAWGTQIESGSARTSLIYTSGSAVTRDSDRLYQSRQIPLDPAYATLSPVFAGVSTVWALDDISLTVPVRDATYWLERPLQPSLYAGTLTYEGPTSLAGVTKPKTRGAVNNVTPVLVDAAALIYQYTDGPGTLQTIYEGGYANRTFASDTTNLYAGSTASGQYRTDNSRGLFQLGNTATGAITCDCTGAFPSAGTKTVLADIARYLLTEDLQLPSANINTASFTTAATNYAYAGGVHFASGEQIDGVAAVNRVLAGFGAVLFPARDGTLRALVLTSPAAGATAAASYNTSNVVSLRPIPLPPSLSPPAYRIRVGYSHNYTVQTSGLLGAATSARKQYIAQPDLYGAAVSTSVLNTYARPNDPPPIFGSLTNLADATATATRLMTLFSARRRLYAVELPVDIGIQREIGDLVQITWPVDNLQGGQLGTVYGDSFRSNDATLTLKVLI